MLNVEVSIVWDTDWIILAIVVYSYYTCSLPRNIITILLGVENTTHREDILQLHCHHTTMSRVYSFFKWHEVWHHLYNLQKFQNHHYLPTLNTRPLEQNIVRKRTTHHLEGITLWVRSIILVNSKRSFIFILLFSQYF